MLGKIIRSYHFSPLKLCVPFGFTRPGFILCLPLFFRNRNSDNNRCPFANATKYQYSECIIIKQGPVGKTFFPTLPPPLQKKKFDFFFQARKL